MITDYSEFLTKLMIQDEEALNILNMGTTSSNQKDIINKFSQLIYNWRHTEDINNVLLTEMIAEDVSQLEISDEHKNNAIRLFKKLLEIIRENE